jgi:hypothetical protein
MRGDLPSLTRGLARQVLRLAVSWRETRLRFAWGLLACIGSLFLAGGASGAGGDLLWEDQVDKAGFDDAVRTMASGGGQVFVAGSGESAAGNQDFLVRAYDAKTGALLWEDQVDKAGDFDGVNALAVEGRWLFAAGFVTNAAGNFDVLIRAYAAKTGTLLWEDQVDKAGSDDAALALAVQRGQVFVGGFSTNAAGNNDFLVRTYAAKTRALLWEDQVDKAGSDDAALALAVQRGQVFVGGLGTNAAGNFDVLIRAYAAK